MLYKSAWLDHQDLCLSASSNHGSIVLAIHDEDAPSIDLIKTTIQEAERLTWNDEPLQTLSLPNQGKIACQGTNYSIHVSPSGLFIHSPPTPLYMPYEAIENSSSH